MMEPFVSPYPEPPVSDTPGWVQDTHTFSLAHILRGEIAATESYKQVMEKVDHWPELACLKEFLADHNDAVDYWKIQMRQEYLEEETSSGPWGSVVEAFIGLGKMFGEKAALKALQEGEEHGLKEYNELLNQENLTIEQVQRIQNVFIPNQQKHIQTIGLLLENYKH